MVDFVINVKIDPSNATAGAAVVKQELNALSTATDRLRATITGALTFVGIGIGVKALADLADAYTQTQNRIRITTSSQAELQAVMARVFSIADETGVKLESLAGVYSRVALAGKNLGLSQNDALEFTKLLGESAAIVPTSTQKMAFGLQEVAQAFSVTTTQARQMRAIINDVPYVAVLLADYLNRTNPSLHATAASLKELATEGKITNTVLAKFAQDETARAQAADEFAKIYPTIGRAIQSLRSDLIQYIGNLNQTTGVQGAVAQSILFVAHNLDIIVRSIIAAGIAWGINYAVNGVKVAYAATLQLFALLATNPLLAFLEGMAIVVGVLVAFGDKMTVGQGRIATMRDVAVTAGHDINESLSKAFGQNGKGKNGVPDYLGAFLDGITPTFAGVVTDIADAADLIYNIWGYLWNKLETGFVMFTNKIRKLFDPIASIVTTLNNAINPAASGEQYTPSTPTSLPGPWKSSHPALDSTQGFLDRANAEAQRRIKKQQDDQAAQNAVDLNARGPAQAGAAEKLKGYDKIISQLKNEIKAYDQPGGEDAYVKEQQAAIANKLAVTDLTKAQKAQTDGLLRLKYEGKEYQKVVDSMVLPQENLRIGTQALNKAFDNGIIGVEQYNQKLRELQIAALQGDQSLTGGLLKGMYTIQQQAADLGTLASKTVTDGFKNAEDALVQFAETGKLSFQSLIRSMIDDLIRLSIRASITGPLLDFLNPSTGGKSTGASGSGVFGALGNAATWASSFFADGDVFNSPTSFNTGSGPGMFAENGPESIMPLRRTSSGALGVIVTGGSGGGTTKIENNITVNVSGQQGTDNANLGDKIATAVKTKIEQSQADFVRKQQRTGGMLNAGTTIS